MPGAARAHVQYHEDMQAQPTAFVTCDESMVSKWMGMG
jgi:hypothetical protein